MSASSEAAPSPPRLRLAGTKCQSALIHVQPEAEANPRLLSALALARDLAPSRLAVVPVVLGPPSARAAVILVPISAKLAAESTL